MLQAIEMPLFTQACDFTETFPLYSSVAPRLLKVELQAPNVSLNLFARVGEVLVN